MSCNCGCHDDKPPATGWRRYLPVVVAVLIAAALIAGAVLRKDRTAKRDARGVQHATSTGP